MGLSLILLGSDVPSERQEERGSPVMEVSMDFVEIPGAELMVHVT
jgi:hypothetical protein